jgi:uncharacterized protein (DUF1810 family)
MDDPYDFARFDTSQDSGGSSQRAVAELRAGRKTGHSMWFVFPQVAGLGQSPTSRFYAISTLDEAKAYLEHPVLGPRLRECADILAGLAGTSAEAIFGGIHAVKLRSSITRSDRARAREPVQSGARQVLGGQPDPATDRLL